MLILRRINDTETIVEFLLELSMVARSARVDYSLPVITGKPNHGLKNIFPDPTIIPLVLSWVIRPNALFLCTMVSSSSDHFSSSWFLHILCYKIPLKDSQQGKNDQST